LSNWSGKYIIGLTGNIATGKSVVRRMLEHLGAYTIDADALSHRAIARGAPGYQPVVDAFGKYILEPGGEIDRLRLGRLVFNDPEALKTLETIIHPLVEHAVDLMVQRATQPVVVIEAIKLLEGKLVRSCNAVWTTYAPETVQKARLMDKRDMSEAEALQRIHAQSAQELKTAAANVVINNVGSFEDTWEQVVAGWKEIPSIRETPPVIKSKTRSGELAVTRGRPGDSANIASLINRLSRVATRLSSDDVMASFGDKAYLLLNKEKDLVGLAGWQVENLVARTTDIYIDPSVTSSLALKTLMVEVESASQALQCEVSLVFLSPGLAAQENIWKEMGYIRRTPQTLGAQAWRDAALESQPGNTILLFKQLRQDRILRPI